MTVANSPEAFGFSIVRAQAKQEAPLKALASGNSAFSTFFQTLPKLPSVVKRMRPTWHLESLDQVDAAFVKQHREEYEKLRAQHSGSAAKLLSIEAARANVQAYAMYVNEYVRPQQQVHEVA